MPGAMVGDLLLYSAFRHYLFQLFAHRPIVDFPENQPVFRQILVPFDYLQGNIQQLHLERDICLVPFRQYPFLTVHLHYFVRCEFFHIHERQGGEAGEMNRSRTNARVGLSNSCAMILLISSSVRYSRSLTFGLIWNCANGFLGISPL